MLRTHTCGELRKEHAGQTVTLAGWVQTHRIQGKLSFLLLRDREGTTQCFVNPKITSDLGEIRRESVVQVTGVVKARPENQIRSEMKTGEVELSAESVVVLNAAEPLPLEIDGNIESSEETRMQYRFLDLRRESMQQNLILRHKVTRVMRTFLDENRFLEIETPMLAKSTPEGARDYLVPSRVQHGNFYALPQSPQTFKQLLMISGYDRYAQIVRCFRDEDLRADRQPEFTQLDLELSFVDEEDIMTLVEKLVARIFKEVKGVDIKLPLPRIPYKEVMQKYNSDKPDLREEWGVENALFFVVDFPMFEYNEDDKRWYAMHHPFTQPKPEFHDMIKAGADLKDVHARAYDLVLNGSEIAGGSIRIHSVDLQRRIFDALGLSKEEYEEKFGFLLSALSYGAPPHGGIAFGLDRLCAILAGSESIRDVIAFPKNKDARDLMLDAPSGVSKQQLDDLGLQLKK